MGIRVKMLKKVKKATKSIFWAVFFVVLLAGIIAGWDTVSQWLVVVVGGLVALLGGRKAMDQMYANEKTQEVREKEKELDRDAEDRRKKAEALAKEDEEQKEKVEDWRERKNRWKSRGSLVLVLCMLLVMAVPAWAEEEPYADLTREELVERLIEAEKLLDEADRLLAREMVLKEEYRRLYLEAEEDLRTARELDRQKDGIITALSRGNQTWGLVGRAEIGQKIGWQLGVVRKNRNISFGAGIGGGDGFSVWGEVGLWIR